MGHALLRYSLLMIAIFNSLFTMPILAGVESDRLMNVKREIRQEFPEVKQVSIEQLSNWLSQSSTQQPLLLDVREPDEYQVSHIQGAVLASHLNKITAILDQQPSTRKIIFYCSVGYRSSVMVKRLQQLGYRNIFNLEGSIFEWANNDYPLVKLDSLKQSHIEIPTQYVHPYNFWWGRLLKKNLHVD